MPGGRPTKYNKELLEKAREYVINFKDHGHAIPSISGLSLLLDVSRETLHKWARQELKKEFTDILAKIKETQHQVLVNNGLLGEFNSNITKLVLGKHGYHDKQDTTVSGDEANPVKIKIEVVNADS